MLDSRDFASRMNQDHVAQSRVQSSASKRKYYIGDVIVMIDAAFKYISRTVGKGAENSDIPVGMPYMSKATQYTEQHLTFVLDAYST
jgi:hypothetical protein